jgi:hypothetical protein
MKKVGWGSGFGERVGWNLGEVGERVGWLMGGRERQLHNFTSLHTNECYGTWSVVSS